jgi:hypothetical protein
MTEINGLTYFLAQKTRAINEWFWGFKSQSAV